VPEICIRITHHWPFYKFYRLAYLSSCIHTGRHNIGGPFELDSGENLTLGGIESDFVFKSRPASSLLTYQYDVDPNTGIITLAAHAVRLGFELKNAQNVWDIDFHGK